MLGTQLKAMGHSSINVSLTYLRGLEKPSLNTEERLFQVEIIDSKRK